MRLWSLDPCYLDRQGLLALWRESLLALKVLQNKTSAYKYHPQLIRFKRSTSPVNAIRCYLFEIYKEACRRKYKFDFDKVISRKNANFFRERLTVTKGQLEYEMQHLQKKLVKRDIAQFTANLYNAYDKNTKPKDIMANRVFKIIEEDVESWEKRC